MSTVIKASEFVAKLKDVATNYKTLYVMGCFGAPLTAANKTRYCNNHDYNKQPARTKMIQAASEDTFGFDCVCLIKGILWGWNGDKSKTYGGASYAVNGVPDIGADSMITKCSGVSTTGWGEMLIGEALWCSGHIGIYIGDGLAVECTPAWKNKVQITAVSNIAAKSGYNSRKWTKHGKLPYIDYDVKDGSETANVQTKTVDELAYEVINGKWGNGNGRKSALKAAGYDYNAVQNKVNELMKSQTSTSVTGYSSVGNSDDAQTIWSFLFSKIGNAFGVAGLIGNLYAESALRSNNLQNSYESKLGYTDASYTAAVDNGSYTNFEKDSAGYGLAQWTYHTRKANLLKFAQGQKKSIGDLTMQLEFLMKELSESYSAVLKTLKSATSVKEASDAVLINFERPVDIGDSVKNSRASYGQKYYNSYSGKATTVTTTAPSTSTTQSTTTKVDYAQKFDKSLTGTYKVNASSGLNIRTGAGTSKTSLGILRNGAIVSNYGYYSLCGSVKWLYVKTGDGQLGFVSSQYLTKR